MADLRSELKPFFLYEFDSATESKQKFHLKLCEILGTILQLPPEELQFETRSQGKPVLSPAQNHLNLSFNLSHSGEKIILGVAIPSSLNSSVEIGVDIQKKRPVDVLKLAKRFFHPDEYQTLLHTDATQRDNLFFTYWVQKEAYVKMRGESLGSCLKCNIHQALKGCSVETWTQASFFYAVVIHTRPLRNLRRDAVKLDKEIAKKKGQTINLAAKYTESF